MLDRATLLRGFAAVVVVSVISLLFIASYAGALHEPKPHDVPIAVTAQVPAALAQRLDASEAFEVHRVATPAAALQRLDERKDYGAIVATPSGLQLVVSRAASSAVAQVLDDNLLTQLQQASGARVTTRIVHPLPAADARGLVGFYTAVGWVVAGYLGATVFGLAFGTSPRRSRVLLRLGGLLALGVLVGLFGTLIAGGIADWPHGFAKLWLVGLLTVVAVGAATMAFQSLLGVAGTGIAILVFVVLGNPAGGGAYVTELLPQPWRAVGPLLPPGAATAGIRDAAYFPEASLAGPILVLLAWLVAGAAVAVLLGRRGRELTPAEEQAAIAGAAAA
jgi:hypothetical protein